MKKTFILLIVTQVIVVVVLGFEIYKKQKVLGTVSISPTTRNSIIFSGTAGLKYFIEPKPNSPRIDIPPELLTDGKNHINNDSLNEEREYKIEKNHSTFRIVAIGDSFTYGAYVPTQENWTEVLERRLLETPMCPGVNFEVINLGMSSYDLQYSLERFRLRGQKYNPDLVLWFMIQNDFEMVNEMLLDTQEKIRLQVGENGGLRSNIKDYDPYELWQTGMAQIISHYGKDYLLEKQKGFLQEFNKIYADPLVVLSFPFLAPEYQQTVNEVFQNNANYRYHEVPTIYEDSSLMISGDGHPSVLGHKLIGEDLYDYLRKNSVIFCD